MKRNCPYKMAVTSLILCLVTSQRSLLSCITWNISETELFCLKYLQENSIPLFFHDRPFLISLKLSHEIYLYCLQRGKTGVLDDFPELMDQPL